MFLLYYGICTIFISTIFVSGQRRERGMINGRRITECSATEWFYCFLTPCYFKTCYAYPDAQCSVVTTSCGGCQTIWKVNGQAVDCNAPRCPPGIRAMSCPDSLCRDPFCPDYPKAICRSDTCGNCKEYYVLSGLKVDCFASFRQQLRHLRPNVPEAAIRSVNPPNPNIAALVNNRNIQSAPTMHSQDTHIGINNQQNVQSTQSGNQRPVNSFAEFGLSDPVPLSVDITSINDAMLHLNQAPPIRVDGNTNTLSQLNISDPIGPLSAQPAGQVQSISGSSLSHINTPSGVISNVLSENVGPPIQSQIQPNQRGLPESSGFPRLSSKDNSAINNPNTQTSQSNTNQVPTTISDQNLAPSNVFDTFGFSGPMLNDAPLTGVVPLGFNSNPSTGIDSPPELVISSNQRSGNPINDFDMFSFAETVSNKPLDPVTQVAIPSSGSLSIQQNLDPSNTANLPNIATGNSNVETQPFQSLSTPTTMSALTGSQVPIEMVAPQSPGLSAIHPQQIVKTSQSNQTSVGQTVTPFKVSSCLSGALVTTCPENPCADQVCHIPGAKCYESNCGSCHAQWYVGDILVDCSPACPRNMVEAVCTNPCAYSSCPAHPNAICRMSKCQACTTEYFENNKKVNCDIPSDPCLPGEEPQGCTCFSKICPYDFQARCRIVGCGSKCKIEYYKIGQNGFERVKCGWFGIKRG